ncbi:MAG: hypothetical protein AB9835_01960 [Eubacteriales bacterium]
MSNTLKGKGIKGSKFWIQVVINSEMHSELNDCIGDRINWLTPLTHQDNYSEYELRHEYICNITGISKDKYTFWPQRQPQWDAIGVNEANNILYLVEAKSHLKELKSKMNATSKASQEKIENSMRSVFEKYYSKGNFEKWKNQYYQLGNRLTFLNKLNDKTTETGWQVILILLNFIDDFTYKPTELSEWIKHYKDVFRELTGNENVPDDVLIINYSVKGKSVN